MAKKRKIRQSSVSISHTAHYPVASVILVGESRERTGYAMRYLLIDRITEWKAGQRIKGIKNVAMTEVFLEWHFPKNPVMPGVLLIESFVQLAGWLEAASSDFKRLFLITKVRQCKFYGFALPGDQVELDVERLAESGTDKEVYSGVGKVGGKKNILANILEGVSLKYA